MEEGQAFSNAKIRQEAIQKWVWIYWKEKQSVTRILGQLTSLHSSWFKISFSVATMLPTGNLLSQQKEMSFSVRKILLHFEAIETHAPVTSWKRLVFTLCLLKTPTWTKLGKKNILNGVVLFWTCMGERKIEKIELTWSAEAINRSKRSMAWNIVRSSRSKHSEISTIWNKRKLRIDRSN